MVCGPLLAIGTTPSMIVVDDSRVGLAGESFYWLRRSDVRQTGAVPSLAKFTC